MSIVQSSFSFCIVVVVVFFFFFFKLNFPRCRNNYNKRYKEKNITSRDEDVAATPIVQKTFVQARKKKTKPISTAVDLDDLLSRRGPKKQKSKADKAFLPKVPKFVPPTVNLDESPVDVEPVQTIHPVQSEPTPQTKTPCKPPSSEPSDRPSNLVLDENYAWRTIKGIVTNNEVNKCFSEGI